MMRSLIPAVLILTGSGMHGWTTASAQPAPPPATAAPKLLDLLVWDAVLKEQSPLPGQATADFIFSVTNPSESEVIIDRVQTSCGCTVAKLPSQPWILAPHTNGQLAVSVNLANKSGTLFKTITVISTNSQKILTVKVMLPESPAMVRSRNQQMALADQQAVFKGDCAKCHVEPAVGLMGKELYVKSCGICHEAKPRATMVPDLAMLSHPTDYAFWKQIIAEGKPKTLMPAFAAEHGGPLTIEQIESLAKVLTKAFPTPLVPAPAPIKTSTLAPQNGNVPGSQPTKN